MTQTQDKAAAGYKLTPVMQQYLDLKDGHSDALLFFRLGDFYEMFFEDAEQASDLLDLTLTTRNRNEDKPIPMCGIPYHAARGYIAKLLEAGVKVAICEQIDLPARGIARREVTRVITPGTSLDEDTLAPDRGNFLAAVASAGAGHGVAFVEFSTGEVRVTELGGAADVENELCAVAPTEILLASKDPAFLGRLREGLPRALIVPPERLATVEEERAALGEAALAYVQAADGLGEAETQALTLLVGYLHSTQGGNLGHLRPAERYDRARLLQIDRTTRDNLEIVQSVDGTRNGSLLSVIDRAVTAMGRRLTRDWLLRPLCEAAAIARRLDAVEHFVDDVEGRERLRAALRNVGDLERLAGRIGTGTATPRDLVRLLTSLKAAEEIRSAVGADSAAIGAISSGIDSLPELRELISLAIVDEAPAQIGRGPLIREGYNSEVDRLRAIRSDGKGWMMEFEAAEKQRTGISNLKIGFNKIFGYYIEISRTGVAKAPAEYVRKQTIANGERYITDELKQRESELLGAEERLSALETHLFDELVHTAARSLGAISGTAAALARLDALAGLAETAHRGGYVRPEFDRSGSIEIIDGRHPVVEAMIGHGFVPNDCRLGPPADTVIVITGPNMAGKSTYMRQVALITLLAHCGSFVPAKSAKIPLVDRIFTRIGASDRLSRGQSTFMVEMSETANILRQMTADSLVILDEIGRGTSTYDGISIAWAVAEAMVKARVKTLFATHYHELAALAGDHDGVGNHSVGVRRYRGEVVFLYRVESGAASRSYGIEVAALAGVPPGVIDRARELLRRFELSPVTAGAAAARQRSLFDPESEAASERHDREDPVVEQLRGLDTATLTPLQALNELDALVREARKRQ